MRPQAPDASDYPVRLEAGSAALLRDVEVTLDRIGIKWTVVDTVTEECRDLFGRDRGARYGVATIRLERPLTDSEHGRVLDAARSTPEHPFTRDAYGQPIAGYFVGRDSLQLVTPCLRPE